MQTLNNKAFFNTHSNYAFATLFIICGIVIFLGLFGLVNDPIKLVAILMSGVLFALLTLVITMPKGDTIQLAKKQTNVVISGLFVGIGLFGSSFYIMNEGLYKSITVGFMTTVFYVVGMYVVVKLKQKASKARKSMM